MRDSDRRSKGMWMYSVNRMTAGAWIANLAEWSMWPLCSSTRATPLKIITTARRSVHTLIGSKEAFSTKTRPFILRLILREPLRECQKQLGRNVALFAALDAVRCSLKKNQQDAKRRPAGSDKMFAAQKRVRKLHLVKAGLIGRFCIGRPLGTRLGISLRKFCGLAFGSSKPFWRNLPAGGTARLTCGSVSQCRINTCQHRRDRTCGAAQIARDACGPRIVLGCLCDRVEVETDRVFEFG